MPAATINWVQLDRYYTFERGDKFCVGYFYHGCRLQHTREFESQEARADWVRQNLQNFRSFNCER